MKDSFTESQETVDAVKGITEAQVSDAVDFWADTMLQGGDLKKVLRYAQARDVDINLARTALEKRGALIGDKKIEVFREKLQERLLREVNGQNPVRLDFHYSPAGILKEVSEQSGIELDVSSPLHPKVSTVLNPDGKNTLFKDSTHKVVLFDGKNRTAAANKMMLVGQGIAPTCIAKLT